MDCLPHIHAYAYHAEAGYRSDVPGIGALCRRDNWLAAAGAFSNSLGKPSAYAAFGWQPLSIGPVRMGGYAGAINGYPHKGGNFFPFAAALVSTATPFGEVHISILPPVRDVSPLTVGISFTINLK